MGILLSIVLLVLVSALFGLTWGFISSLNFNKKRKEKFINSFRVIRYDKWYCIQQQNEISEWYFIRSVSIDTAERTAIMKKYIIRETHPDNYLFFYDQHTAQEIVKILRENWDNVGVILDK